MTLTYRGALELASHEALVRQTYKDSVGVLTWCVGMTNATGHRVERYIGKPAPLQHCMNVYVWALRNYAKQVDEAFAGVPLTEAQYAAALSFAWNTGAIKRATWVQYFRKGQIEKARQAFMNWTKPSEIAKRRAKECDLFFDGKWSSDGTMIEYTRVRSNMSPDWSSAKRVDVSKELQAAFGNTPPVTIDQPADPDYHSPTPTLTPSGVNPGVLVLVVLAITAAVVWVVNRLRGKRSNEPVVLRVDDDPANDNHEPDAHPALHRVGLRGKNGIPACLKHGKLALKRYPALGVSLRGNPLLCGKYLPHDRSYRVYQPYEPPEHLGGPAHALGNPVPAFCGECGASTGKYLESGE